MNDQAILIIKDSISVKQSILEDQNLLSRIQDTIAIIVTAFKKGNRIYLCGNGGSAADAQHLAAEFTGRFYADRNALPAEALHCNTSYLTAVGNDYSFDEVYARIIRGIANKGDILIGLSTSGNSTNILKAFQVARQKEVITIAFTGETGGKLKEVTDYLLNVPSKDTPRIQECHILIGHIVCQFVEAQYFSD